MATKGAKGYSLKLEGEGLSLDQEVTREVAVRIVSLVFGGTEPAATPPGTGGGAGSGSIERTTPDAQGISVGEFIEQVGAKRNPDKIVAMGVHLKDSGADKFTSEEIKPLFQDAGESTPGNFARDLKWAQNAKWIAPTTGDPNTFYVTKKGEKAVRDHFPDEVRKATAQPVRKRARQKKPTSKG